MTSQIMKKTAESGEYYHPHFHQAMNIGIQYLQNNYGKAAVTEYLHDFAESYYAPLRKQLAEQGLGAVQAHFENIYRIEKCPVEFSAGHDSLEIDIPWCPAVRHITESGHEVAEMFMETTNTVYRTLCEATPYEFVLRDYDHQTGRAVLCFKRRTAA